MQKSLHPSHLAHQAFLSSCISTAVCKWELDVWWVMVITGIKMTNSFHELTVRNGHQAEISTMHIGCWILRTFEPVNNNDENGTSDGTARPSAQHAIANIHETYRLGPIHNSKSVRSKLCCLRTPCQSDNASALTFSSPFQLANSYVTNACRPRGVCFYIEAGLGHPNLKS